MKKHGKKSALLSAPMTKHDAKRNIHKMRNMNTYEGIKDVHMMNDVDALCFARSFAEKRGAYNG